jgi:hypothetical protein
MIGNPTPYALGMMIQSRKYTSNPGMPPGSKEIRNASLNQNELMPKNSARPPHTPAMILFCRERRRGGLDAFILTS